MITKLFHRWEHQLASVDTNRIARPFEWGLDWLGIAVNGDDPATAVGRWSERAVAHSDEFFGAPSTGDYHLDGDTLTFPSAVVTPDASNNTVRVRIFRAEDRPGRPKRAVLVLPQWNSDPEGHVGLCRLFAKFGLTALRLSLPYHDARMPPGQVRAEFIVSANIGRTLIANRQAVLDAKRTIDWAVNEGYRVGICGTSLGSCLAMLTMTHDPRVVAGAFNHVSPYFADVVWRGLSTRHVRQGLGDAVTLDKLRQLWMPISPWPYIERVRGRRVLLVHASYDLTFPLDLSRSFIDRFAERGVPHDTAILPCGHYTTGKAPFKYLDGYYLTKFLVRAV